MDGYFGTASAMSTILLVVTGVSMFVVNKYFNRGQRYLHRLLGLEREGPLLV